MSLINYVKTATKKWLLISEIYGDSNRCTSYRGKSDTHDTYVFCASPRKPRVRFLRAVPVRGNLSLAINIVGQTILVPRKRAPDIMPSTLAN
jgi:hypothetical protein